MPGLWKSWSIFRHWASCEVMSVSLSAMIGHPLAAWRRLRPENRRPTPFSEGFCPVASLYKPTIVYLPAEGWFLPHTGRESATKHTPGTPQGGHQVKEVVRLLSQRRWYHTMRFPHAVNQSKAQTRLAAVSNRLKAAMYPQIRAESSAHRAENPQILAFLRARSHALAIWG